MASLSQVLQAMFEFGASDLHLRSGATPMCRVGGHLRPIDCPASTEPELIELCAELGNRTPDELRMCRQLEFSCAWPPAGRFRGHYSRHQHGVALALRVIPAKVPSFEQLRLPAVMRQLCDHTHGLFLATGATGMGKSTTLAAMLSVIAQTSCRRIVTIEDPIEFAIEDGRSCVTQHEVGRDVASIGEGLRGALRQDPDVIMIGEVRDAETADVLIHAALSGHLVLSAMHFSDTTATINGIIGLTEPKAQLNWRIRLAEALRGILSQRLLPRRSGQGRVLATEMLVNEPSVRNCILDETRTKGIRTCLERGRSEYQTHTLDQALLELLQAQQITIEVAHSAAASPSDLLREVNLRRIA